MRTRPSKPRPRAGPVGNLLETVGYVAVRDTSVWKSQYNHKKLDACKLDNINFTEVAQTSQG